MRKVSSQPACFRLEVMWGKIGFGEGREIILHESFVGSLFDFSDPIAAKLGLTH
jgi:hypothetical protein